ncbi:sirohydrochlorin chelatase [Denitratisoma oestradiolicum]|uniref:Sirohydrochlorin cobaltochelatase n=1 Tax=Denitratisoma oestradiolicum TaxID=311182 RepID=A0A6S6Y618_9PROT|nr:CbiX/SirB N-terminal domain-containing protein [Denitratisoma oestradiolicum]TWO79584.1 cobalamin biosynthesis protein CbiX [Denitratisoma oestradiolicum]CAB1368018.1 conserved protein of unknown function [Denitratisoma oestradiolicum]
MKGIVLFGHGARNAEWVEPFHRIRAAILARVPEVPVEMGFLELMRPTFAEAVDGLVARGVTEIVVVPVFMAAGSHVKKDLPLMAAEIMERHPQLEIAIAAAVGESPQVIDAMATYILGAAG